MSAATVPVTDDIALAAAEWMVRLSGSSSDLGEHARLKVEFDAWLAQHPAHAAAAASMQAILGDVDSVRQVAGGQSQPGRIALDAAFRQNAARKKVRRAVVVATLAAVLAVPVGIMLQAYPLAYVSADMRTHTGQWQSRALDDGSQVTLSSGTGVDIHFDQDRRTLRLVRGAILVQVAHDASRPFVVETAQGRIRALGTRFVVDQADGVTTLTMLESKVAVSVDGHPDAVAEVTSGQRVRISDGHVSAPENIDPVAVDDAWKAHQFVMRGEPLPDLLDALNRQRVGKIAFDRDRLQHIRLAGVFPLDDTDRALQLLVNTVPSVRVRSYSRYLVVVDQPANAAAN